MLELCSWCVQLQQNQNWILLLISLAATHRYWEFKIAPTQTAFQLSKGICNFLKQLFYVSVHIIAEKLVIESTLHWAERHRSRIKLTIQFYNIQGCNSVLSHMTSSLCQQFLQIDLSYLFATRDSFDTYLKLRKALNPLTAITFYKHEGFTGASMTNILSTNKNEFGNLAAVSPSLSSIKAS